MPKATYPLLLNEWVTHVLRFENGTVTARLIREDGSVYFEQSVANAPAFTGTAAPMFGGSGEGGTGDYIADYCVIDYDHSCIKVNGALVWGRE